MPDYTKILSGQSWNALSSLKAGKKPVFLTYSFNAPSWGASKFGKADKAVAQKALKMWGDACGIRFIEVKKDEAELKFQWQWNWTTITAWAKFPELSRDTFDGWPDQVRDTSGGNVYLNTQYRSELSQNPNFKLYVLLHEIGHALGLKHPFHKMPHNKQLLNSDLDHVRHTVMSYTGGDAKMGPIGLGALDIQAIRALYGSPSQDGRQVAKWSWSKSKETLTQIGKSKSDVIYGVAVKDIIQGANGNDQLYGFGGNDILYGGQGNDVLSGGFDDDTLNGGAGSDNLAGGDGSDQFVFDTWFNGIDDVDQILDFNTSWDEDKIVLSSGIFTTLAKGLLSEDAFAAGKIAEDKDDRIIYDFYEQVLYYDVDGSDPSPAVRFVRFSEVNSVRIEAADFFIV
jgi:hypothetical protein